VKPTTFLLLLLACPFLAHGDAAPGDAFKAGVFDPPRFAPDFELQGSNGAPLTLSGQRGKVVALEFGFSNCQKVCPVTLANLARVSALLGDEAGNLQVIFVTVDPQRDTPQRLNEYLAMFNPAFLGATGTPAQLEAVDASYGIEAQREAVQDVKLGYEVHHSSSIYLIDRDGKLRLMVPFGMPAEDILHDVRILIHG
jgi:protein SCO1/2